MNCYQHADIPAVAFCRSCGKALCTACQRPANGTLYCEEHFPAAQASAPYTNAGYPSAAGYNAAYANAPNPYAQPLGTPVPPVAVSTSPALAFVLGFIPGVGAIYNGQYLKGLVHAVIFGLIVSLLSSVPNGPGEPLLGITLAAFLFYMPFEALHTAKRRLMGQPVEEFSSLFGQNRFTSRTPIGPIFLILIGVLFLLDTLHLVEFRDIARFWPVLLIAAGAFMLYNRMTTADMQQPLPPVEPIAGEYGEPRQ